MGAILVGDPRQVLWLDQVDDERGGDDEGRHEPGVERVEGEFAPLFARRRAQLDGGHADGAPHVPGQHRRPPKGAQEKVEGGRRDGQTGRAARLDHLRGHERAVGGEQGQRQRGQVAARQVAQVGREREGQQVQRQAQLRQAQAADGHPAEHCVKFRHLSVFQVLLKSVIFSHIQLEEHS